jgi:hypothetical protein
MREAERWDVCPMIGANVFLGEPKKAGISEAARELTTIAAIEEYEGKRQEWAAILQGELEKAQDVQNDFAALCHREVEQAVFATFLHSQPIGQKATVGGELLFTLIKKDSRSRIQDTPISADALLFFGGRVVKIQREGYEEPVTIPKAERALVESAVQTAVRESDLWLTSGPAGILAEEIPAGLLTDDARLQAPPQPIPAMDVLPENLPDAWSDKTTTALGISVALSKKMDKTLPWVNVCEAIDGAFRARLLERTLDSGA